MELERFVADNPGCAVARPDLVVPGLLAALPSAGVLIGAWGGVHGLAEGSWWAAGCWLALALASLLPARRGLRHLRRVLSLYHHGHASFAVSEQDVLLVDAVGNTVVVALDRVTGLEVDGFEARLRTDSDLQGVVYTVMFQLFDEDVPGPTPDAFFDALAPRLRKRSPHAIIVRHAGNGALTT
jgi:hypothetical protein